MSHHPEIAQPIAGVTRGRLEGESLCRLELAAAQSWPASIERRTADGWLLRATPGLDRGRSNNALTPCRELAASEIGPALERVEAFARDHGIAAGIQVSPLVLHDRLGAELDARGWTTSWPTLVLVGRAGGTISGGARAPLEVSATDHPTREWLETWARCEPGRDVQAHASTVFALLRGRATFARAGDLAVAIAVEAAGLVGLFCLAVAPGQRRSGIGTALVRDLLGRAGAPDAYLQVEQRNAAALAMYAGLGFSEGYRYCHRLAP